MAIQPFAAVLAGCPGDPAVRRCSANLAAFLGREPASALGRTIETLLPAFADFAPHLEPAGTVSLVPLSDGVGPLVATCLVNDQGWCVMLEHSAPEVGGSPSPWPAAADHQRLGEHTEPARLLADASGLFRRLLGYEEVEILGTDALEDEEFAARSLETQPRLIADPDAPAVPVVESPGAALHDFSALPCHAQPRSLNADGPQPRASFQIPLRIDQQTCGWVACRHPVPLRPDPWRRAAALELAATLAGRLREIHARDRETRAASVRRAILELGRRFQTTPSPWTRFPECASRLAGTLNASAVALVTAERQSREPPVAPGGEAALAGFLSARASGADPVALLRPSGAGQAPEEWPVRHAALLAAPCRADGQAGWLVFFRETRRAWTSTELDHARRIAAALQDGRAAAPRPRSSAAPMITDAPGGRAGEEMGTRFAAIAHHVPGVLYQYRLYPDGTYAFTYATDRAEELWGVDRATLFARGTPLSDRVRPEDRARLREAAGRSVATLTSFTHTVRYEHPDLGPRWISVHDSPVREAGGSILWHGYASDVTELVVAQQTIQENEARLRAVIDAIPATVLLKDTEGRWLMLNQQGILGTGLRDYPWQGMTDDELARLKPEIRPSLPLWRASDEAAWSLGRPYVFEDTPHQVDGPRHFEVTKIPLFKADGSRQALVVVAVDITERKQAADLIDRERRLFTAGPVAVIIWQPVPGMPVEYVSDNIEDILGYPAAHVTSPHFHYAGIMHPDDLDRVRSEARRKHELRIPYFEQSYRLRRADGTYRWIYDCSRLDYAADGSILSIRGYLFDQTLLKEAQDALRNRNEQIASISAQVPGMLYEFKIGPDGISFPYVSDNVRELCGVEPAQVMAQGAAIFAHVHPEDRQSLVASIETLVATPADWNHDFRIVHPDLGERWLHASSSPRRLDDGSWVWAGYCSDITERKQDEQRMLREGKREAIERLAGGVAHDFNNYLSSISLAADLLLNLPGLDARVREIAGTLRSGITAATGVARQLLAFTKEQPVHRETIGVDRFLRDCAAFALRGSSTRALIDVSDHALEVVSDPDLLRQAIFNLILNSRQAMQDKGSVFLSADDFTPGVLRLRVGDTGPGIPSTHRGKIFEPYFTTKSSGSGLGLFVVRSLLHRLDGEIQLDASITEGTTFLITLPLPKSEPRLPGGAGDGSGFPDLLTDDIPPGAQVLLLEDDESQTLMLDTFFTTLGVPFRAFDHGEAFLSAVEQETPVGAPLVCLLDITIRGGLGGLDIAPRLRALLPAARIFLVSGYSAHWEEKERFLVGLDIGFIPKPYHLIDLKKRMFAG